MEYKYKGQFNVDKRLSDSLTEIISVMELDDYICKIIEITIPEHIGLVTSYIEGNPYEGQYSLINGAQWMDLIENYSKKVPGKIDEETYSYFIVMRKKYYDSFLKLKFKDKKTLEEQLSKTTELWKEYEGILCANDLIKRFSYLKFFFDNIDKWRSINDRVTIDDDILEESIEKTLSKNVNKK